MLTSASVDAGGHPYSPKQRQNRRRQAGAADAGRSTARGLSPPKTVPKGVQVLPKVRPLTQPGTKFQWLVATGPAHGLSRLGHLSSSASKRQPTPFKQQHLLTSIYHPKTISRDPSSRGANSSTLHYILAGKKQPEERHPPTPQSPFEGAHEGTPPSRHRPSPVPQSAPLYGFNQR